MKAYRLSQDARRDLDEIWDYSRDKWGARRASTYLRDIRTVFQLIVERPHIGLVLEGLEDDYRKRSVGSHVIFYRVLNDRVEIDRVLHQNMDATRLLSGD